MTPKEKADSVVKRHQGMFNTFRDELKRLPHTPRSTDYKAMRIIVMLDEIGKQVAPVATCKKGCSYCCYQPVAVFTWEIQRIAKFARRKHNDFNGHQLGGGEFTPENLQRFNGIACPFLVNDQCSVYAVRPTVCRSHLSLSDYAIDCDVIGRSGTQVPYFNLEEFNLAQAMVFLGGGHGVGDIREFFDELS